MKRRDIIRRAARNLRQAKGRTILTALAISVGAFTLTLSLAIGAGTRNYFATIMETNINPQVLLVAADKNLMSVTGGGANGLKEYDPTAESFGGGYSYKTLGPQEIATIKADNDVTEVTPGYDVQAEYFRYNGSDKKYSSAVMAYDTSIRSDVTAGTLPELGKHIGNSDIVIPESYLETLGVKQPKDAIGKPVSLHVIRSPQQLSEQQIEQIYLESGRAGLAAVSQADAQDFTYTVRAVIAKPATSFAQPNQLSIASSEAQRLSEFITQGTSRYQRYMTANVAVKDGVDPEVVKQRLQKKGLSVMTAKDLQGMLFTMVNVAQGVIAGFGVLALLASIFGIINTQYISVLERTSQIGLMKALGMSNRAVGKLFRYEAAWIGFLGGLFGAAIAVVLGLALNPVITKQLKLGEGNSLLAFQVLPIVLLIIFLVFIAIAAGWLPSRKAARLNPTEALRTE